MKYKFEEFSDIIIDPTITIGNEIIINKEKNTFVVNVILMPTNRGVIFELPFNGLETIEAQVNNKLVEFEYNGEPWEYQTNFKIKMNSDRFVAMVSEVNAIVPDVSKNVSMFGITEIYLDVIDDEFRTLVNYFGGEIYDRTKN